MKIIVKNIIKIVLSLILIYLLYFIISFGVIFRISKVIPTEITYNQDEILAASEDQLYATLIDTHKDALDVRLGLINEATKTITMTTYYYHGGKTADLVTAALLKKADEGIKIEIIIDGKMPEKNLNYKLLSAHENINYYLFEPVSVLLPYANNNVYHNKIITIDEKYGLIGGRNIDDRFLNEDNDFLTFDYEVLVFGSNDASKPVVDMNELVKKTIDYKHTKLKTVKKLKNYQELKTNLIQRLDDYLSQSISFTTFIDNKIKVDNITLIESPLNRFNKNPIVAKTIFGLYDGTEEMVIQSPYIVSGKVIKKHFPDYKDSENIKFVTNNVNSNPNFMALTGYFRIRNKLAKTNHVYEYQGTGSIHGKTVTIGNNISVIGSMNIDSRSMLLSAESAVIIIGEAFNEKLTSSVDLLIDESLKLDEKGNYIANDLVEPAKPRNFRRFSAKLVSYIAVLFEYLIWF